MPVHYSLGICEVKVIVILLTVNTKTINLYLISKYNQNGKCSHVICGFPHVFQLKSRNSKSANNEGCLYLRKNRENKNSSREKAPVGCDKRLMRPLTYASLIKLSFQIILANLLLKNSERQRKRLIYVTTQTNTFNYVCSQNKGAIL